MEPLSIAASIMGILSAAASISEVLRATIERSRNAPKSIRDLQLEVNAIRTALGQIQAFILRKAEVSRSQASLILVEQVVVTLAGCVITFSDLELLAETLRTDEEIGIMDRVRWMSKADSIAEMISKLQNHKLSLLLMLTILESQSSLEVEAAVDRLCGLVEEVSKGNIILEQRLMSLLS